MDERMHLRIAAIRLTPLLAIIGLDILYAD